VPASIAVRHPRQKMTCPHRACRTNIGGIKKTRLEKGQKDADHRPIPVSSQGLRHATVEHLTLPDTIIREPEKNPNPFRPTVVRAAEEDEIRDEHRLCTTSGHASSRVIQKGSSEKTSSLSPSERSDRRFCENCRLGQLTCLMLSVHVGFAEDRVRVANGLTRLDWIGLKEGTITMERRLLYKLGLRFLQYVHNLMLQSRTL
jgi:hypothetical protein